MRLLVERPAAVHLPVTRNFGFRFLARASYTPPAFDATILPHERDLTGNARSRQPLPERLSYRNVGITPPMASAKRVNLPNAAGKSSRCKLVACVRSASEVHFANGVALGHFGLLCPFPDSHFHSTRCVETPTRLWVTSLIDRHRACVNRFCACLIRVILKPRRGFIIANAGNPPCDPAGNGCASSPLLGEQACRVSRKGLLFLPDWLSRGLQISI
jgi:hypothetical protein